MKSIKQASSIEDIMRFLWGGSAPQIEPEPMPGHGADLKPYSIQNQKNTNVGGVRQRIISIAANELGHGAENQGRKYFKGTVEYIPTSPKKIHWCGIFALWVLHQAGIATDLKWEFGKGFLYHLKRTNDPKPGDLGYKNKMQHHNIIESVDGDKITTIDGNSWGGKVVRNISSKSSFAAFFSIDSLL